MLTEQANREPVGINPVTTSCAEQIILDSPKLAFAEDWATMERIYDRLDQIKLLWKKLELTKPDTSEYQAIMNRIRVLSDEYRALIDVPKKSTKTE